jgi:hypothetical protein
MIIRSYVSRLVRYLGLTPTAANLLTVAAAVTVAVAALGAAATQERVTPRAFPTPEDAVRALIAAAKADGLDGLLAIFGPDGKDLVASSDAEVTRRNREVFAVAAAERWALQEPSTDTRVLIVGNEGWPFPVPLIKDPGGWRFDTAAGREEVVSRRIGRNELAVMQICRTYVEAQRIYAASGRDGQPAGVYATTFRSDPGKRNGLYWPAGRRERRSPLGDLVANAAAEGRSIGVSAPPAPFHGYLFKILTAQGPNAPGGAKSYLADGRMSGGFALVAWPARYGVTGIMTFVVSRDAVLHEKDLGPDTATSATAMTAYDPDASWAPVAR